MAEGLFKGRTAIVTGGARGIGLACAAKIAAGGGRLALWDRDLDRAKQSAAALGDAIAVEVDVTSEKSLEAALATTEKRLMSGMSIGATCTVPPRRLNRSAVASTSSTPT